MTGSHSPSYSADGAVLGQSLQVEVLRVAADVRLAPRVVRRVPDDDARRARQRDAAHVEPRRRQVALEPDRRQHRPQVRVVRQQRLARTGPRPGHDPVVRALALRRQRRVPEDVQRAAPPEPAAVLARYHHRRVAAHVGEQRQHRLVPELVGDLDAQELGVPVPGEHPRHERHDRAAVCPRTCSSSSYAGGSSSRIRYSTGGAGIDGDRGPVARPPSTAPSPSDRSSYGRDQAPPGAVEPDRPEEPVDRDGELADQLGQPARREPDGEVRLEQPFLRHDEPLGQEHVRERRREDVGDAPPVADDLDGLAEPGHAELTLDHRQRLPRLPHQHLGPVTHPCAAPFRSRAVTKPHGTGRAAIRATARRLSRPTLTCNNAAPPAGIHRAGPHRESLR